MMNVRRKEMKRIRRQNALTGSDQPPGQRLHWYELTKPVVLRNANEMRIHRGFKSPAEFSVVNSAEIAYQNGFSIDEVAEFMLKTTDEYRSQARFHNESAFFDRVALQSIWYMELLGVLDDPTILEEARNRYPNWEQHEFTRQSHYEDFVDAGLAGIFAFLVPNAQLGNSRYRQDNLAGISLRNLSMTINEDTYGVYQEYFRSIRASVLELRGHVIKGTIPCKDSNFRRKDKFEAYMGRLAKAEDSFKPIPLNPELKVQYQ